jgi:mRNA-degrading endonuclease toxin of MazEF toxin-antitoxin module
MTRNEAIESLYEVFVVLATTTIRDIPTEDGMPRSCVLNADHTETLAKGFLIERITTLGAERLAEVCAALGRATNC